MYETKGRTRDAIYRGKTPLLTMWLTVHARLEVHVLLEKTAPCVVNQNRFNPTSDLEMRLH